MFAKTPPILREFASMLYWTMLAACTVGPGTVVTCARAGSEYGLSLIWALVFASLLAYTLQEGTARLTIVSGRSLGQCLRVKYANTACKVYDTALICWLVGLSVFFGNTLYECNNWAGGLDAILALPGAENTLGLRIGSCIGYAVVVLGLLVANKTDMLGVFLGLVMIGMAVLFLVVVVNMDVDGSSLGWGFLPNIPAKRPLAAEPTDIIISLVGTTSIGFNLFLGGSMAEGKKLGASQRGIAFSTAAAFVVSVLILIVGSGDFDAGIVESSSSIGDSEESATAADGKEKKKFAISDIAKAIEQFYGTAGVIVFAIGFIAAALSSMLTVPLGAALAADSVFSSVNDGDDLNAGKSSSSQQQGVDNVNFQMEAGVKRTDAVTASSSSQSADSPSAAGGSGGGGKKMPHWIYLGIMFVMVAVATIVISANVDRAVVILIAQVFNGCLLPFFALCLLLCINDPVFMGAAPQRGWANLALATSVLITLFLANNVLTQKVVGDALATEAKFGVAAGLAVAEMALVLAVTSLGKDILRSFRSAA